MELAICGSPELSRLDRRLSQVFAEALPKTNNNTALATLHDEQRDWVKERNSCEMAADARACTRQKYETRIASLQATYRLAPERSRMRFECEHGQTLFVTFVDSDTPSVRLERFEDVLVAVQAPLTKPAPGDTVMKYAGPFDTEFLSEGRRALLTWPQGQPRLCQRQ